MKKMKKTKKVSKSASKTKSIKAASRKGKRGGSVAGLGPRKCGECGARGHNRRSHEPGGKMSLARTGGKRKR